MAEVIIALDGMNAWNAMQFANKFPNGTRFKVGLELAFSPEMDWLMDNFDAYGNPVFLDLKLSDIPTTVRRATKQIVKRWQPWVLSVRTNVVDAAVFREETLIAQVPTLTSDTVVVATKCHWAASMIVCGPDIAGDTARLNPGAQIITPGVRLPGEDTHDHARDTSISRWADYIVVGRPITGSAQPLRAFLRYQEAAQ